MNRRFEVWVWSLSVMLAIFLVPFVAVQCAQAAGGSVTGMAGTSMINCGVGGGSCVAAGLPAGAAVSLNAVPEAGSAFAGWSGSCGGSGTCQFAMAGNAQVGAHFTGAGGGSYTLSVKVTADGGTPPPPPPACGTPDKVWQPETTLQTLWPIPPAVVSGSGGFAIQFTADTALFPAGMNVRVYDEAGDSVSKQIVISSCAHDFNPVGGQNRCTGTGQTWQFGLFYNPSAGKLDPSDCVLQSGGVYYLNFRAADLSGTARAQLGATARQAPPPPPPPPR